MLHRRLQQTVAQLSARCAACVLIAASRAYHMPGWKTKVSTKDARTREQREADRKARQIEKLPRPEALHDFQYPYDKTVLSDYMFQYPVYENELDTPHLFNLTPPPNFFLYWNVSHFNRTDYPAVPDEDHRLYVPSRSSLRWSRHRTRMLDYFHKHELCPNYIPHVHADVNMSIVFSGRSGVQRPAWSSKQQIDYDHRVGNDRNDGKDADVSAGDAAMHISSREAAAPVRELTRDNFWLTAHCGNYIELADLQTPPTIFLYDAARVTEDVTHVSDEDSAAAVAAAVTAGRGSQQLYTLMIVSPDYPYRVPPHVDRDQADRGFFLHYMVANLTSHNVGSPGTVQNPIHSHTTINDAITTHHNTDNSADSDRDVDSASTSNHPRVNDSCTPTAPATDSTCVAHTADTHVQNYDVVIPYVPPLPTEYAGTARLMCVLYEQSHAISITPLSAHDEQTDFPLAVRSNYRIRGARNDHVAYTPCLQQSQQTTKQPKPQKQVALPASLASLRALERTWNDIPSALTFFQTSWDIQVQEFYDRAQIPEPALPHDDEIEALLEFHARRPADLRIRSRHRADGSTNMGDENSSFWMQALPTLITDGSMQSKWSRRTAMGTNGVPVIYPHAPTRQK